MKSLRILAIVPFMLIGCGDDGDGGSDTTTTTSTTDTSTDTTPGVSPVTGVNTNLNITNPNPTNSGCDGSTAQTNTTGAKYPWGGLTVSGTNYTCNGCPFGYGVAQGMYRLHGFADENGDPCNPEDAGCEADYTTPDAATDLAEILYFDGNTWYSKYKDVKAAGGPQTVESRGYYFCSMKPENPNAHVFWYTTDAEPEGTLGANTGDIKRSDVILGTAANLLIFWFDGLTGETGNQYKYCRLGEVDTYGNTCANPF
ncbi:MAG: hypothetical protein IT385_00570 [Deltaproteobacteria bacterium]|nr:hypothetical protein [Deltaproteobacteria bacterium]